MRLESQYHMHDAGTMKYTVVALVVHTAMLVHRTMLQLARSDHMT